MNARLDRSETAKLLVSLDVPASTSDENGVTAMSLMIAKMPPVAKEALDQFHSLDRANRKQYYYLNHLEPGKPGKVEHILAKTPLEEAVRYKQMELIMHPTFKRLIQVKWEQFGKTGSVIQVVVQLLYCLLWTVLGVTLPRTAVSNWSYYDPPSEFWWRIVLESLAVSVTVLFIWQEFAEVSSTICAQKVSLLSVVKSLGMQLNTAVFKLVFLRLENRFLTAFSLPLF